MRMATKQTTNNKYYMFTLDDYGTVAFVSASKPFFGTLDDFARLLSRAKIKALKSRLRRLKRAIPK